MPKGRWENFGNQVRHVLSSEGRLALPDVILEHFTPNTSQPKSFYLFNISCTAACSKGDGDMNLIKPFLKKDFLGQDSNIAKKAEDEVWGELVSHGMRLCWKFLIHKF